MLTHEQYINAIDAHVQGAMDVARAGRFDEATKMIASLISLSWELTRPEAQYLVKNISHLLPDDCHTVVVELQAYMVVDSEGRAIMAWGQGRNHDGNNVVAEDELPEHLRDQIMETIDRGIEEYFGDVDRSRIVSTEDRKKRGKVNFTPFQSTHVEITKEAMDKAAEEFNEEFDRIFELWGGGDESG